MKIRCIVLLAFVLSCLASSAQRSLSGIVTDAGTHKPIPLANVFLSNTSVGTVTDEKGNFTIQRFPDGRYEVIVSCIGYETFIVNLQSDKLPASLTVALKPKVEELQEVIVEPYEKNGWDKWGKFFIENFIGTSANSAECKLVNKEVIRFRMSKKKNILQAFADEPIILENQALGYVLKYTLVKFVYDYNTNVFFYQGYPLFTEMDSKRKRQQDRWEKNRENTYYGSLMHFMRSLYRNKLIENNFEVRKVIKISAEEKARVKKIYQQEMRKAAFADGAPPAKGSTIRIGTPVFASSDSGNYYKKVMQSPEDLNVVIDTLLTGDSIAYAIDTVTAGLYFKDYLRVTYTKKKNPFEYAKYMANAMLDKHPITSEITITDNQPVSVLANGSYFEGVSLLTMLYWGWWEKLGNMLPYGYWPGKK